MNQNFFVSSKFRHRFLLISEQGFLPDLKSNSNEFVLLDFLFNQISVDI